MFLPVVVQKFAKNEMEVISSAVYHRDVIPGGDKSRKLCSSPFKKGAKNLIMSTTGPILSLQGDAFIFIMNIPTSQNKNKRETISVLSIL